MLICALMIGFCTAFASAATPVWLLRAKAGIAAAMLASNLIINPINAALDDSLLEGIDPVGYVTSIQNTPWTDYIDMSTIVVRPDVVTIDGVSYSDIWLGPDAANSLRLTGLDFVSAYNILSNQSEAITYATGEGSIGGVPIYLVDGKYVSQVVTIPANSSSTDYEAVGSFGDFVINTRKQNNYYWQVMITYNGNNVGSRTLSYSSGSETPFPVFINRQGTLRDFCDGNYFPNRTSTLYKDTSLPSYVSDPFSFDYTSGNIDIIPDPEDGLLMRVPSSYDDGQTGSVFNYDIHDLINIYPQVDDTYGHDLVFDPSLNPDFDVDLDMGNALGDIITAVILAKLADLLGDNTEVIYAPMPEKDDPGPVDPDLPDPDVPIGEQDPVWLDNLLRWLKQTIDNLGDRIHDAIDSIHEDIQEIISQISELADKILEDIELGPAKLFDKALDILKTLFLPLLLPIRAMMNLWHYVVEWIQSISSPFTWIFGIMSGTSGNMVLPIYALLAGGICISIYKALGR